MAKTQIKELLSPGKTGKDKIYFSEIKSPITSDFEKIWHFIGLSKVKSGGNSNYDFITQIRKGLPSHSMKKLAAKLEFSEDELATIFHVSKRTLKRRAPADKLNPEQTERVIELAKLYSRGQEVFGSLEEFKEWMNRKVWALGDKKPKEFLDTSIGINLLLDELVRIEHGVYS